MNWRDITDLQQLDILTAQRLGYTVRSFERDKGAVWELYAPNGFQVGDGSYASERAAWRMGCPDYTSDLNAAAGLPMPKGYRLRITIRERFHELPDSDDLLYQASYYDRLNGEVCGTIQLTEALARTLAWHALADERERGNE